ncbi:MAG: DUF5103 domain-containing protein [Flavobacteriales bacterium TMED288]|nr:hypothetical protein [Flavobacteriales bacterium]RPG53719.1 MAG: DUF5103 domain-containing protein [Flavobacteriales bacterium TMED288]
MLLSNLSYSQPDWEYNKILEDSIFNNRIKTCLLYSETNNRTIPKILINSNERLVLQFDDLNLNPKNYMYKVYHCNYDWSISDLSEIDYSEGFVNNFIENYDFSSLPNVQYVHYEEYIPNKNFNFIKSGNYILSVYDYDSNNPLFNKRFIVYEDIVKINANIHQSSIPRYRKFLHEIDFNVNLNNLEYFNIFSDCKVIIYQNHNWYNSISDLVPSFINDNLLEYDYEYESSFNAGNNFRSFDTRSTRYKGENIEKIFQDSVITFVLKADKPYKSDFFSSISDIDGYYIPDIHERNYPSINSDYVWVNFCLNFNNNFENNKIFIYGGLTNWKLSNNAILYYDKDLNCYENSLLLKQGYYNYSYLIIENDKINNIDGDFFENNQIYNLFFYVHDYNYSYDRVVGFKKINSNSFF